VTCYKSFVVSALDLVWYEGECYAGHSLHGDTRNTDIVKL